MLFYLDLVFAGEPHAEDTVGEAVNLGADIQKDALGGEKIVIM